LTGPHYRKTWDEIDRIMPMWSVARMRCVLRQIKNYEDERYLMEDVCGVCLIELVTTYVGFRGSEHKTFYAKKKQSSSICHNCGHKRTKYNCNTCRKLWRDTHKDSMRAYYKQQEKKKQLRRVDDNYGVWAAVWLARQKLMKEVRSYG